jgi:cell pole-organizing protein PopZ
MANAPQQEAMEDILSSIRTTMAEETAKVGSGSADLIDAAAKQDGEEEVLELTPAEMVPESGSDAAAEEGLIDLEAFASSGESKPADPASVPETHEELTTPPQLEAAPAEAASEGEANVEAAADEFDRLLAEISQEQENQVAAVEEHKQALLAEEEPLGETVAAPQAETVAAVTEQVVAQAVKPAVPVAATVTYPAADAAPGAMPQVAFPAEVLAMALRPMVQEWLAQNLPEVVERLVKAEIDKLGQS